MKTTENIRNEYAISKGYSSWEDLYQKSFVWAERVDDVMKLYALEAIKADRSNLLKYAKAKFDHMGRAGLRGIMVDNESILNAPILEAR